MPGHEDSFTAEATRHLQVLEALDGAGHVSQRSVAETVGLTLSRVNRIIKALLANGQIRVVDHSVRPFAYALTPEGREYVQRLSHHQYAAVFGRFREAQHRIRTRLQAVREDGVERVVLYGAGEVMDVVSALAKESGLRVVKVVDESEYDQKHRADMDTALPERIEAVQPDAVLVTMLGFSPRIRAQLEEWARGVRVVEL
jgi:DNA-binding MarR family transcriptional regulator